MYRIHTQTYCPLSKGKIRRDQRLLTIVMTASSREILGVGFSRENSVSADSPIAPYSYSLRRLNLKGR